MHDMNDLLARADRALDNGRLDQAITLCRQVREQDTERFEANYWLFWALERKALMGDTPDAGELRQLRRWLLAHTEHPEQSETVARARHGCAPLLAPGRLLWSVRGATSCGARRGRRWRRPN